MDAIFPYIFKAALALMLLYSLYGILLRRETLHDFNRVVLLLILILSFALPLIRFTAAPNPLNVHLYAAQHFVNEASPFEGIAMPSKAETLTWGQLLTFVYLIGVAVALLMYAYRVVLLALLIASSQKVAVRDGVTVCLDAKARTPYNWWRWVVMNPTDWQDNAHALLPHELAHARLGHSCDMLLCELAVRLQWFNPMAWALREDLRAIHEFQADRAALASGISSKEYQLLLIKKAVSPGLQPAANSLNSSSLQKRLVMMYTKKTQKWAAAKALYLLPLVAMALLSYAQPQVLERVANAETTRELALDVPVTKSTDDYTVVTVDQSKGKSPQVTIETGALKGEGKTVVVSSSNLMPSDSTLVIIDGKEVAADELKALSSEEISHVNVLKGQSMKEVYPDARYKAYNAAVLITTKSHAATATDGEDKAQKVEVIHVAASSDQRLDDLVVFINGREVKPEEMKRVDTENIASMDVVKLDELKKEILGERADQYKGVILITTKDAQTESAKSKSIKVQKDAKLPTETKGKVRVVKMTKP